MTSNYFSVLDISETSTQTWDPLEFLHDFNDQEEESTIPIYEELAVEASNRLKLYEIPATSIKDLRVDGEEVGDDRKDQSKSPIALALCLAAQSIVTMMGTSEEDTVISDSLYNFCEVTSYVPAAREQSFHTCRKTGNFSDLGFNDSPILRIIMDVSKGDGSHSSSPAGKVSLLSSRLSTVRSEFRLEWNIASLFQDAMLRTWYSPEPKYLPNILGGGGAEPLFGDPSNLYMYVHGYRRGTYQRIYASATEEARSCLSQLERGKASAPVICWRLRDRQEYLHGTYAEKIFVPTRQMKSQVSTNTLPMPIYREHEGSGSIAPVELRLLRSRRLIGRRQAELDVEHHRRLELVLRSHWGSITIADQAKRTSSKAARAEFNGALQGNTALQQLFLRKANGNTVTKLISDENFQMVVSGQKTFTYAHALWLTMGGKSETFTIYDLHQPEDMFIRSEVSQEESFKVGKIPLRPMIALGEAPTLTSSKVGLYEISLSQEQWADKLISELTAIRDRFNCPVAIPSVQALFANNREWVNDDSLLVQKSIITLGEMPPHISPIAIVTSDKKLLYRVANSSGRTVYAIDPKEYIIIAHHRKLSLSEDPPIEKVKYLFHMEQRCLPPRDLVIDTGSVASHAAKLDIVDGQVYRKELVKAEQLPGGFRRATYTVSPTEKVHKFSLRTFKPLTNVRTTKLHNTLVSKRGSGYSEHTFGLESKYPRGRTSNSIRSDNR